MVGRKSFESKLFLSLPDFKRDFNAGFDFDNLAVFLIIFIGIFLAAPILVLQYCWYRLNRRIKKILFMKTGLSFRKIK